MSDTKLIPKQRQLNPDEKINTFEAWRESLLFHIIVDPKLARFADEDDLGKWAGYTETHRGFVNDAAETDKDIKMTGSQKAAMLKVMLGSIASYASVISHTYITRQATSLNAIFQRLRAHYGFRKTGSMITSALNFKLEPMESREALWERIYTFIEGNLLTKDSEITHEGEQILDDEEFSPTLLNLTVIIWLNTIHPGLPALVTQRFATVLRDVTIYSIRAEISDSLPSMLQDLEEREGVIGYTSFKNRSNNRKYTQKPRRRCCLCEAASRPGYDNHFLSSCPFLPADDRKYISKAKIREIEEFSDSEDDDDMEKTASSNRKVKVHKSKLASISRVDIISSPVLQITVNEKSANITLDSGAEATMISEDECKRLGLEILPTNQEASMADGDTPLDTIGEVHFVSTRFCKATRKNHKLHISGLVTAKLSCPMLAGMPFWLQNDVYLRPKNKSIHIGDCCSIKYTSQKTRNQQ